MTRSSVVLNMKTKLNQTLRMIPEKQEGEIVLRKEGGAIALLPSGSARGRSFFLTQRRGFCTVYRDRVSIFSGPCPVYPRINQKHGR
jgi:hypothetical protein